MVGLAQLVNESLLRHGIETSLDPHRLQWSEWFRCESCFSFLRVPDHGGIFALAEEVIAPGETAATDGRRMLAIYRISEAEHLGLTMGRLFLPGGAESYRLPSGRCYARYVVIEDEEQRRAVHRTFQRWMASSTGAATGACFPSNAAPMSSSNKDEAQFGSPTPFPAGF